MTKKQVIAALAVSTLVLSTAGTAFADEVTPLDPTTPSTEVVASDPSSSTDTSSGISDTGSTTEPTVPVDPTTPSTGDNTGDNSSTNLGTSEDESSDPGSETTEPEIPTEPEKPSTEEPGEVEVPTTDGGKATVVPDPSVPTNNPNISAETAQNAGASQVGTTSTMTGQIVRDVTRSNPVTLYNGASLVDIRDGFVTLSSGEKVTPESVGVTSNADGTYTAKTIQGDMVTLPHTGEKNTAGLSAIGFFLMSLLGVASWRKHQKHKI